VYTLTNKRLVLRFGVAMPMMVNMPLQILGLRGPARYSDGSGDIMLTLNQRKKMSYLMLWPNVRSWQSPCARAAQPGMSTAPPRRWPRWSTRAARHPPMSVHRTSM
jgi:hypothetical protein